MTSVPSWCAPGKIVAVYAVEGHAVRPAEIIRVGKKYVVAGKTEERFDIESGLRRVIIPGSHPRTEQLRPWSDPAVKDASALQRRGAIAADVTALLKTWAHGGPDSQRAEAVALLILAEED